MESNMTDTVKIKPKDKPHYVNNRDFSMAVNEYAKSCMIAEEAGEPVPQVPEYVAKCFLKICEGLSYKANFIRYTYREEMVMDAVENCLKAIRNYDYNKATRTEKPNAFSYFTQIAYYAFLRRLAKEKKVQDIKLKYIEKGGYEDFFVLNPDENYDNDSESAFVDELRSRIERVHGADQSMKEFAKIEKNRKGDNWEQQIDNGRRGQEDGLEMFMGALSES